MKIEDNKFDYDKTLKTNPGDTFLNIQSYLYITSRQITKLLFYTQVTPHQVIFLSMLFGIAASYLIIQSDKVLVIAGAILLFYKNVLDKVDGSLARAKGLDSRRGRFYDSISDFIVNISVFTAIGISLYQKYGSPFVYVIVYSAMICSMLQCSFFIYYQVSFIKATGKETVNRLIEKITDEDLVNQDLWTLFLQRIFQVIYGWQDYLIYKIDKYMLNKITGSGFQVRDLNSLWYKNKSFLTIASTLSIGTHMVFIAFFAIFRWFDAYIFVNLILMNLLLILSIIYKYLKAKRISATNSIN